LLGAGAVHSVNVNDQGEANRRSDASEVLMDDASKACEEATWSGLTSSRYVGLPLVGMPRHGDERRPYTQGPRLGVKPFHPAGCS
jgi:hypothetical protein